MNTTLSATQSDEPAPAATTSLAGGRSGRRALRRTATLFLAALAMVTAMVSGASTASAASVTSSGYPGATSLPVASGAWVGFATGQMTVPYRLVTESTRYAAYNQYVCVTPRLWEASGAGWILSQQSTSCAWIPSAATSVNVNGVQFHNLNGLNTAIYSVDIAVTWQLSNGALIGRRLYDYNSAADYRCTTIHCKVGTTTWGGGAFVEFDA